MNRYYQVSGDMSAEKSRDACLFAMSVLMISRLFLRARARPTLVKRVVVVVCRRLTAMTAMTVMALALSLSAQIVQGLKMIALLVMVGNTTRNAKSAVALEN